MVESDRLDIPYDEFYKDHPRNDCPLYNPYTDQCTFKRIGPCNNHEIGKTPCGVFVGAVRSKLAYLKYRWTIAHKREKKILWDEYINAK